jgi:hypothetical protein
MPLADEDIGATKMPFGQGTRRELLPHRRSELVSQEAFCGSQMLMLSD